MTSIKKMILAFTVLGASAAAQAADSNFAGLSYGLTSDKVSKSSLLNNNLGHPDSDGVIAKDSTFGVRFGQLNDQARYYATYEYVSGSHNGIKLRQQNLLGSYDMFLPVTSSTKLFGGATAGLYADRITDVAVTAEAWRFLGHLDQAGVLQQVSQNTSVELGYRYLRSNASTEMSERGGSKQGSLNLDSSAQTYLSANYAF